MSTPLRLILASLAAMFMLPASHAAELTIGSKAPPLSIEHWFHDKTPVTEFSSDQITVVEFWATWCGPCIASIPHLSELQQEYGDAIKVISVSDEDPATVEAFLDREKDDTTFRDITSHYWLTTDPDQSMKNAYMKAAEQSGIPTAFVVGKTGEIEWIGHPMRLDEPLRQIVAGTWDREAYARQMAEEQKVRRHSAELSRLVREHDYDGALSIVTTLLDEIELPEVRQNLERMRTQIKTMAQAHAREHATQGLDLAGQRKAFTSLIEMGFCLQAGDTAAARAILDRLATEIKQPDLLAQLDAARQRLDAASPSEDAAAAHAEE